VSCGFYPKETYIFETLERRFAMGALLFLIGCTIVLGVVVIVLLAHLDIVFTTVPQGSTVFINKGDAMDAIWPNVEGFRMSNEEDPEGRKWLVCIDPKKTEEERIKERLNAFFKDTLCMTGWFQKLLWKSFGVRFMGWTFLNTRRHKFDIKNRRRLVEESGDNNAELKSRIKNVNENQTVVDHLLFVVPRPMILKGIILPGDNSQISLLLLPIYRQVIPSIPVYSMGGDFFTQLDGAIEAYVTNCLNSYEEGKLTLKNWTKLPKSGENSPLLKDVYSITADRAYRKTLSKKPELRKYLDTLTHNKLKDNSISDDGIPSGILPRFGFALSSLRLIAWEPYGQTADLVKAIQAKEVEERRAEGLVKKGIGEKEYDIQRAEGKARLFGDPVKALTDLEVDTNVAAEVLRTQIRTENLAGLNSKITTYIEGDSSASIMVSTK
jgi:hypothetical protein